MEAAFLPRVSGDQDHQEARKFPTGGQPGRPGSAWRMLGHRPRLGPSPEVLTPWIQASRAPESESLLF